MNKIGNIRIWIGCVFIFFYSENINAQFSQLPVAHPTTSKNHIAGENLRAQEEKLTLPFWDDFSSGEISIGKWESLGTTHSFTVGINPPSIGSVLLDGVDETGNPYSTIIRERGEGDQLISLPFDLSNLSEQEINSLYLSFFWQAGGKSEFPDADDFLELYFMDSLGNWDMVWDMQGGDQTKREVFTQSLVRVPEEYAHADFKFKFSNRGRLSGPFDGWILDYIFLNSGRTTTSTFYEDRTLTQLPNSPLGKYSAIPLFELQRNAEAYNDNIQSQFNNLSNRFRAMEYSIQLRNSNTGTVINPLNTNTPFNPVPLARERRDFGSNPMSPLSPNQTEEFDLETLIYITSGDRYLINSIQQQDTTYFTEVDFRVNDTIRSFTPIRDYLAYDNNSLDYSAGINQRAGMLAVRYSIEEEAFINGLSINFSNFAQVNKPIELLVWNNLNAEPIFSRELGIPTKESIREFSYFPLDTLLRVSGDFYVGFRQFTNDFIHVGLDKSNDNGSEIFFNVIGEWEQNITVAGSLMVRPHLTVERPAENRVEDIPVGIRAYPNPVTDRLYLEGEMEDVIVFDTFGRQINIPMESYEDGKILNFMGSNKGIYMIRAYKNEKSTSIRVLVK
ncbi:MAG TPA: T9SS type A sorting domain-containing protein [Anditalea sp.]|nr:T9SS type A sorting domain-containing protein [Anditalea sp.]